MQNTRSFQPVTIRIPDPEVAREDRSPEGTAIRPSSAPESWMVTPRTAVPQEHEPQSVDPAALPAAPESADAPGPVDLRDERSTLQLYLNEIRRTPLLTLEEETQLAHRIQRGDAAAREHMIRANLRLVVKIAFDYRNLGLPLLDLISEGNLGLIRAVERFDPAKGGKLSTYAAWWIRQTMKRAVANQSKTIRLPAYLIGRIAQMRSVIDAYREKFGREPDNEHVAFELGVPVHKVALLKTVSARPASLDAPIGDDDETGVFGDHVGDERVHSPDESLREKTLFADLRAIVDALDPRDAQILKLRFGLDGGREMTLEAVGRRFNVSRERIRQLQYLALRQVRSQMHERNRPRTQDEVAEERSASSRAKVFREFVAQRTSRASA